MKLKSNGQEENHLYQTNLLCRRLETAPKTSELHHKDEARKQGERGADTISLGHAQRPVLGDEQQSASQSQPAS